MCFCRQNVLRLVETSYRDHSAYHTEADTLRTWIVYTSKTMEPFTAGIDAPSREELELILDKLGVIIVKNASHKYPHNVHLSGVKN